MHRTKNVTFATYPPFCTDASHIQKLCTNVTNEVKRNIITGTSCLYKPHTRAHRTHSLLLLYTAVSGKSNLRQRHKLAELKLNDRQNNQERGKHVTVHITTEYAKSEGTNRNNIYASSYIIVELNEETLHSTFETLDLLQKNNELMLLSCINATAMIQIITILGSNTTIESAAEITLP